MKLDDLVAGLTILRAYFGGGYCLGAEHDEICCYSSRAEDNPITPEDVKRLLELGWFQPDGGASSDRPDAYDPGGVWLAYT